MNQYTGLKDKNGKEIYEGDIVEVTRRCHTTYKLITFREKVIYDENACGFRLYGEEELLCSYLKINVIGNIYENPELLKEI